MALPTNRYFQSGEDFKDFIDERAGTTMDGFEYKVLSSRKTLQFMMRPYSVTWPAGFEIPGRGGYAIGRKLSYSPIGTLAGEGCVAVQKGRNPITTLATASDAEHHQDFAFHQQNYVPLYFRVVKSAPIPEITQEVLGQTITLPAIPGMLYIDSYDPSVAKPKWTTVQTYSDSDFADGKIPDVIGVRVQAAGGGGAQGVYEGDRATGGGSGAYWCGVMRIGGGNEGYPFITMGMRGYSTLNSGWAAADPCRVGWCDAGHSYTMDHLFVTVGGGGRGNLNGVGGPAGAVTVNTSEINQAIDGHYVCWSGFSKQGHSGVSYGSSPTTVAQNTASYLVPYSSQLGYKDTKVTQGGYRDGNNYTEYGLWGGGGGASQLGAGGNSAVSTANNGGIGAGGGGAVVGSGSSKGGDGGDWYIEFWY